MKIKVYYQTGRIIEHNTEQFCAMEPFKSKGANVTTEFDLRSDLLQSHGLILNIYWNNLNDGNHSTEQLYDEINEVNLSYTERKQGIAIQLVALRELKDIVKIVVDGEMVIWQQNDDLINGVKFANQEIICFSDAATTSINKRAIKIFSYLRNSHTDLTNEQVADLLGYPLSTIETIIKNEAANSEDDY